MHTKILSKELILELIHPNKPPSQLNRYKRLEVVQSSGWRNGGEGCCFYLIFFFKFCNSGNMNFSSCQDVS